jgi:[ribosomal protein S5]-alanine N-acetyltransferase
MADLLVLRDIMAIPILETERLILRPLRESDLDDLFEYAQDPQVADFGMWQPYESYEACRAHLEQLIGLYERWLKWWALEDKATGKMTGRCELARYDDDDRKAEIGYALNRDFWRRGLMREAMRAVVSHGYKELHLDRISAVVLVDNVASIALLEQQGFKIEGTMRHYTYIRGKADNVLLYALLKDEWEGEEGF